VSTSSVGSDAEQRAIQFLEGLGYTIIGRNYRGARGEIDIICEDGPTICFVEVRYRRRSRYGLPIETIDTAKRRRIINTARQWLANQNLVERECRFDILTMVGDDEPAYERDTFGDEYRLK
jgi:putative endonuclease